MSLRTFTNSQNAEEFTELEAELSRLRAALDRANKLIAEAADEATKLRASRDLAYNESARAMADVERGASVVEALWADGAKLRAILAERDARILELEEALRPEVRWFAGEMERKLRANDHKSHWSECDFPYLDRRLDEEVDELKAARVDFASTRNASCVIDEAADVANFAMMIADNAAALSRKGTP